MNNDVLIQKQNTIDQPPYLNEVTSAHCVSFPPKLRIYTRVPRFLVATRGPLQSFPETTVMLTKQSDVMS
jgi:hypothetical protein